MNTENKILIFLVDDDILFLRALEIEFQQYSNFAIETYTTGELCIENIAHHPNIVILDYHLDGLNKEAINGIDTLDKIKATHPEIEVIMLSGQDKIEVAIECMHHQAFDYVVKSETSFIRLQKTITNIFKIKKMEKQLSWYMERV